MLVQMMQEWRKRAKYFICSVFIVDYPKGVRGDKKKKKTGKGRDSCSRKKRG